LRVPVREVSRRDLEAIVNSDSHQGVVARVEPRSYLSFDDLLESVREVEAISILALDGVLDPQNFGAILRAAECFGIDAVLWSKNRGAPIGPVVSKVSVGAPPGVPGVSCLRWRRRDSRLPASLPLPPSPSHRSAFSFMLARLTRLLEAPCVSATLAPQEAHTEAKSVTLTRRLRGSGG
jgi:hypothetical protein